MAENERKKWERVEGFHRQETRVEDSEKKGRSGEAGRTRIGAALARRRAYWELESCLSPPGSKLKRV